MLALGPVSGVHASAVAQCASNCVATYGLLPGVVGDCKLDVDAARWTSAVDVAPHVASAMKLGQTQPRAFTASSVLGTLSALLDHLDAVDAPGLMPRAGSNVSTTAEEGSGTDDPAANNEAQVAALFEQMVAFVGECSLEEALVLEKAGRLVKVGCNATGTMATASAALTHPRRVDGQVQKDCHGGLRVFRHCHSNRLLQMKVLNELASKHSPSLLATSMRGEDAVQFFALAAAITDTQLGGDAEMALNKARVGRILGNSYTAAASKDNVQAIMKALVKSPKIATLLLQEPAVLLHLQTLVQSTVWGRSVLQCIPSVLADAGKHPEAAEILVESQIGTVMWRMINDLTAKATRQASSSSIRDSARLAQAERDVQAERDLGLYLDVTLSLCQTCRVQDLKITEDINTDIARAVDTIGLPQEKVSAALMPLQRIVENSFKHLHLEKHFLDLHGIFIEVSDISISITEEGDMQYVLDGESHDYLDNDA
jgi:hypothetical protein